MISYYCACEGDGNGLNPDVAPLVAAIAELEVKCTDISYASNTNTTTITNNTQMDILSATDITSTYFYVDVLTSDNVNASEQITAPEGNIDTLTATDFVGENVTVTNTATLPNTVVNELKVVHESSSQYSVLTNTLFGCYEVVATNLQCEAYIATPLVSYGGVNFYLNYEDSKSKFTGGLQIGKNLLVNGETDISGDLNAANGYFSGIVTAENFNILQAVSLTTLTVGNSTTLDGTLEVYGTTTFQGGIQIGKAHPTYTFDCYLPWSQNNTLTVYQDFTCYSNAYFYGPIVMSGGSVPAYLEPVWKSGWFPVQIRSSYQFITDLPNYWSFGQHPYKFRVYFKETEWYQNSTNYYNGANFFVDVSGQSTANAWKDGFTIAQTVNCPYGAQPWPANVEYTNFFFTLTTGLNNVALYMGFENHIDDPENTYSGVDVLGTQTSSNGTVMTIFGRPTSSTGVHYGIGTYSPTIGYYSIWIYS